MKRRVKGIFSAIAIVLMLGVLSGCLERQDITNIEEEDKEVADVKEGAFAIPEIVYDELVFKEMCEELVFKEVGEESIGQFVTKELTSFEWNNERENGEVVYSCVSPDDFITGVKHTYSIYGVVDCRFSNQYEPQYSDVFRVYGIVEDTFVNSFSGADCPIIRVYYADYVKQSWEDEETTKELEEVIADREEDAREIAEAHATISDYTGVTKNVEKMWELPVEEYKKYCDSLCLHDVMGFDYNLNGLHVKLYVKTSSAKKFSSEEHKLKYMDKWRVYEPLHDNVWLCSIYNEISESYHLPSSRFVYLYFNDNLDMDVSSLKKGEELIVYGQIVEYKKIDLSSEEVEILVRGYEVK